MELSKIFILNKVTTIGTVSNKKTHLAVFETCVFRVYTALEKDESTLLHMYVLYEFLTADRSCTTKSFEKTLIGRSHLCASFGTFCVQIGQLFEAQ